ncbi:unnamed protein product [Symbiodinium microadriaticum]|nr:unnamed protein product [Symbiodinium microadriaticum]
MPHIVPRAERRYLWALPAEGLGIIFSTRALRLWSLSPSPTSSQPLRPRKHIGG